MIGLRHRIALSAHRSTTHLSHTICVKVATGIDTFYNELMDISRLVVELNKEITRLQEARDLLSGDVTGTRGGNKAPARKTVRRVLSPEARARIAAAQKKRWAATKKAAKKSA
jgi:hypothetical protein